jgi:Protein of unknown function (DUF3499)
MMPRMRSCAKRPCGGEPAATIALRYEAREVLVRDLLPVPDPNFMDLCDVHADRLRVMVGWAIRDERASASVPLAALD